jgi:hypothetical protein
MRACNTPLERYFQDLSSSILKAPKLSKFQFQKIYIRLVIADQGGQKNRNEKTTAILFFTMFSFNASRREHQ